MPTVHGVWMKYVVISAASYFWLYLVSPPYEENPSVDMEDLPVYHQCFLSFLAYSTVLNAIIAALFRAQIGMSLLGKDEKTGQVPLWSYVVFVGFHFPTWLYTALQARKDRFLGIHVADEVAPGFWLGGRYGNELGRTWDGIIDLTCEFPEKARGATPDSYLLVRCWDGVPPTPDELEVAASFAAERYKKKGGGILVHCAHGRGRSTTVMCACMVKAGLCETWEEAFEICRSKRKVVKLNSNMRSCLTRWQEMQRRKK
mmetsp:Transcript_48613/g.104714  ORF Transcript_48613/g.104714 Transcript_48613/m.104714 type:complete len:258 (+) Transcript_48613:163-936(+)|eukprot:CAMPEP_0206576080 /NCGR_PEP_ID=MMETSP0325_2-20121206/30519_1 /ASSEMBLY_ACC=CAM_ASM_000347 /TAXON_ID=2866 /ORGANISM="Crypthecodinium cohnii, Strain Seligo" /LENGTH=257 /DNA_ID=CAMNT_0054081189 /DNA_START=58 /DNA_END=831 /DNA_ORIENTATION=+